MMKKLNELEQYETFRFANGNKIYSFDGIASDGSAKVSCGMRMFNATMLDSLVYPLSLNRVPLADLQVGSTFYLDDITPCKLLYKPDMVFGCYQVEVDFTYLKMINRNVYVHAPKIVFGGYYSYEDFLVYRSHRQILQQNGFKKQLSKLEIYIKDGIEYVIKNFSFQVGPIWLAERSL